MASWTGEMGKQRTKRGIATEGAYTSGKKKARFCDLVSSHIMRRTAITTMLMMGMKEHAVKQVSGHSNDSKSFYRYVNPPPVRAFTETAQSIHNKAPSGAFVIS